MSKELEALNWVRQYEWVNPKLKEKLDIIETELKELEVKREVIGDILSGDDEKKLKALEIIKPCCIVAKYPDNTYELAFCKKICIEKEEYDLLKEVLL